jgi:tetratricopeptide (TPR) repeat protein
MQGRSKTAIEAARKVASRVPKDLHGDAWALYQSFLSMPLYTLVRFGKWDEILSEPRPPEQSRYWTGIWHYARGMAYARTGQIKKARKELAALRAISEDPSTPEVLVGFSNASTLLTIAGEVVAGELAAEAGHYDEALGHLERAVRLEDGLLYTEPPSWYYPVRHTLGAVLLEAGRPVEAEVVYWQDLEKNRDNGYALYGLWKSLEAQGRAEETAEVEERFRAAWAEADVELSYSRF